MLVRGARCVCVCVCVHARVAAMRMRAETGVSGRGVDANGNRVQWATAFRASVGTGTTELHNGVCAEARDPTQIRRQGPARRRREHQCDSRPCGALHVWHGCGARGALRKQVGLRSPVLRTGCATVSPLVSADICWHRTATREAAPMCEGRVS